MSLESNGEDRLRSFGKITMRLHGTKVCINYTSSAVLHRLLWCNQTVPKAPKWYKTQQNMSLESNGVDRVHSLRKILMQIHGMNFCINCTCSARSASSFVYLQNCPKCTENIKKGTKTWVACSLQKKPTRLCGKNFCINVLHRVSYSDEMVPNAPKHYKIYENLSFGSNGADKLRLLWKIPMWHKVLHYIGPF